MTNEDRRQKAINDFIAATDELTLILTLLRNPNISYDEQISLVERYGLAWKAFETTRAAMLRKENK